MWHRDILDIKLNLPNSSQVSMFIFILDSHEAAALIILSRFPINGFPE